jgi:hypothetical protein
VQNILIEKNKTLVDANVLSDFVKEKSVLIYGDDYLEAQNVGSDLESNAML